MTDITIDNIRYTKGNIPVDQTLLNKYKTVREIFDNETVNYDNYVKIDGSSQS